MATTPAHSRKPLIHLNEQACDTEDSKPFVSQWEQICPRTSLDGSSVCSGLTPRDTSSRRASVDMSNANLRSKSAANSLLPLNNQPSKAPSTIFCKKSPFALQIPKKPVKLENTYKMEPDKNFECSLAEMKQAIYDILDRNLNKVTYKTEHCSELTCKLSTLIKTKVKQLSPPRYKIVCQTFIGQNCGQGIEIATRCLWSTTTDSFELVNYQNSSLFATVTVHGLYYG